MISSRILKPAVPILLLILQLVWLAGLTGEIAEIPFPGWSASGSGEFSFLVYGDIQGDEKRQHSRLVDAMSGEDAVAIFHTGDISEDNGRGYERRFLPQIRMLGSRVPFFPSPGNHDVAWGSEQSRLGYRNFFRQAYDALAQREENSHLRGHPQKLWYQLRTPNTLFLVLDSNLMIDEGKYRKTHGLRPYRGLREEQLRWVTNVLEEASRDPAIRWKFVFFHHSPLISRETLRFLNMGGHPGHRQMMMAQPLPDPTSDGIRFLPDLFRLRGVTAVFSGHEHYYERWQERVLKAGVEVGRINYVVTGTGGAKQRAAALYEPDRLSRLMDQDPGFVEFRQRLKGIRPDLESSLSHEFPNAEDPESLFFSYTRVMVGFTEVRFETRDSDGRIRDRGRF